MHNHLFKFKIFCRFSQILICGTCFIFIANKQTRELLPLYAFLISSGAKHAKIYNKGTPSLMCILNFHLVPNAPKFFNISRLFSANYPYFTFSNVTLLYVTVNFFPHLLLFYVSYPPPTNQCSEDLTTAHPHWFCTYFFFLFPQ